MFETVIRNGTLITADDVFNADLAISGGKIAAIGAHLMGSNQVDATDLYVLPGAIDAHVHLEMPVNQTTTSDDWLTGTIAAACGGTTTVIDFVEPEPDQRLMDALNQRILQAKGRAVVDFALHMTLTNDHEDILSELPQLMQAGCTSFKTYLTYAGFSLNDSELIHILEAVNSNHGLVMVHAENDAMVNHLTKKLLSEGKTAPKYHAIARPVLAEGEAIHRAVTLAKIVQAPIYIVHISSLLGVKALKTAQDMGARAYGETCPQYLLLSDEEYQKAGFEGAKFVCSPPLRKEADQQALWDAISHGIIQTVATDHCSFFYSGQKDLGSDNFSLIPGGLPGIEARLSLMHTFGVCTNRISLNRWVEICCTAPAQLFGLFPQKGSLQIGSDADIVLFDPNRELIVTKDTFHEHVDYTPYEGLKIQGAPRTVILRGEPIFQDCQFVGKAGAGKYLHCREFA